MSVLLTFLPFSKQADCAVPLHENPWHPCPIEYSLVSPKRHELKIPLLFVYNYNSKSPSFLLQQKLRVVFTAQEY
jgi:hypothetical protein